MKEEAGEGGRTPSKRSDRQDRTSAGDSKPADSVRYTSETQHSTEDQPQASY